MTYVVFGLHYIMAKSSPDPTRAELEILQVLWRSGPASVRHVWEALGSKGSYTTVLKLLQVMLEKGLVKRDESKLSHIYSAAIERTVNQERMVGGLIDRAFGGSVSELILRALSVKPATKKEIETIRALLSDAKGKPSIRKKGAGK
jgi:BlaI family transcriptional regulator, penicillinase repressor